MTEKIDKTHKAWALLKRVLPNYRKHSAFLHVEDYVTLTGRFWDGGSRDSYVVINLDGSVKHLAGRTDFPFSAPDERIELHTVKAVIQYGTFCGKTSTVKIHVNIENFNRICTFRKVGD